MHICIYLCVCIDVYAYMYIFMCMHRCVCIYVYVYVYMCMHLCIYLCVCVYVYIYMSLCVCIYIIIIIQWWKQASIDSVQLEEYRIFFILGTSCFICMHILSTKHTFLCGPVVFETTWKSGSMWSSVVVRPVAIVDISTYRMIYGYERDHFWCRDILRLIIFL